MTAGRLVERRDHHGDTPRTSTFWVAAMGLARTNGGIGPARAGAPTKPAPVATGRWSSQAWPRHSALAVPSAHGVAQQPHGSHRKRQSQQECKTGRHGLSPGRPGCESSVQHDLLLQQPKSQDGGDRRWQGSDEQAERADRLVLELTAQDGVARRIGCTGNHGQASPGDGARHDSAFELLALSVWRNASHRPRDWTGSCECPLPTPNDAIADATGPIQNGTWLAREFRRHSKSSARRWLGLAA